jgi:hypothetical protein
MLIISVVVIAVVAAAYKFVPLFQEGVIDLGKDVKQILSDGGGRGMSAAPTARVASRPCDGSAEALRYAAMADAPPCAIAVAPWSPSAEAAPIFEPLAPRSLHAEWRAARHTSMPTPLDEPAPLCREDTVVYLSSARLGRRSRSRNR